ncbi:hypothetical protein COCC4DRAFT_46376 [Bipolaris maydis ATCC 48331]|nr:uncharacterized protein COCC4DRAFT_46376 [Bipolaris maydis ATCC 48331]KAH7561720.1 hypothetical protein BM1_02824 [Bipolaris maydis]ENI10676.1 hypothetical protein COCC4DRAFT_46376 [Bipolaris maydis ATCC 48331]KAJ5030538.1 hypothetical protein J3E73DRAFT_25487 [Bipolaris maydis]KAJ6274621.1 hypothetical protein PSV08DRAFT_24509 [Bipolaris maydis]KAJ6286096.1 hypothetical protein J3E71DRAFT_23846 [Bipolaris maydis]
MYPDQPTPPFKSPYQLRAPETGALMESPYPSPGRGESRSKYPQGLGLYEVQPVFPNRLPPSPQPSPNWNGQFANVSSPGDFANPYLSGAFDYPVSRSPLPWSSAQVSPRSSLSYTREMSAFSHDGSEHAYPSVVKVETPSWSPQIQYSTDGPGHMHGLPNSRQDSLTVAPERLSTSMYPCENAYPSPALLRSEANPMYNYNDVVYERAPSEGSLHSPQSRKACPSLAVTAVQRRQTRNRRHTDPAHAAYLCKLCPDKGFARKHNLTQHLLIHEPVRRKDHVCPYEACGKEFVRRADLVRHDECVHKKRRPWQCEKCSAVFGRKDTLTRHRIDGCSRRMEVISSGVVNSHL